jgi:hypothetical protein
VRFAITRSSANVQDRGARRSRSAFRPGAQTHVECGLIGSLGEVRRLSNPDILLKTADLVHDESTGHIGERSCGWFNIWSGESHSTIRSAPA